MKQPPTVRWLLTIVWSILALLLFLTPSGDGTPVSFVSELFGGTTVTDAIGHIIINALLALFWYWTGKLYLREPKNALIITGFTWAIVTELIQLYIPGRGGSLLDMVANFLGIISGVWLYSKLINLLEEVQHET